MSYLLHAPMLPSHGPPVSLHSEYGLPSFSLCPTLDSHSRTGAVSSSEFIVPGSLVASSPNTSQPASFLPPIFPHFSLCPPGVSPLFPFLGGLATFFTIRPKRSISFSVIVRYEAQEEIFPSFPSPSTMIFRPRFSLTSFCRLVPP